MLARWSFPACVRWVYRSEVWEATGIFFVFIGDEKNRLFKFIIAEFLKGDSCCDRGEDGDVCEGENRRKQVIFLWPFLSSSPTHRNMVVALHTYRVWLETQAEVSSERTRGVCWSAWMGLRPPTHLVTWRQRKISQQFSSSLFFVNISC